MIKINLLGDEAVADNKSKLIVGAYVASVVALCLVFYFIHGQVASKIERLTLDSETKELELKKWQKITKDVKDLEAKEAEYNHKISVIANLKKSKIGPVRVLDDLNKAIPERSWLTEIKEDTGLMRIDGKALDNQTIALFMKDLEASDYFESVDLGETRQTEDRGVKIKAFTLSANIDYAGKPSAPAQETPAK